MVVGVGGVLPLPWLAGTLQAVLAQHKAHALLLHAGAGSGALEFSLTLAQAWLCEAAVSQCPARPCGQCPGCRLVQAKAHPDLMLLMPEIQRQALGWPLPGDKLEGAEADGEGGKSRKKPSRQIRIDEVRLAVDWIVKTTSRGGAKVLIVHPADLVNPQAASALLKTLEEPPQGARIVLTAGNPEHLLPTIRSRCQRVLLPLPDEDAALRWLALKGVADPAVLLAAASGHPLAALELHRAGICAPEWAALPSAIARGDASVLAGWPVPRAVDALLRVCHDAMCVAAGAKPRYFPADSIPAGADLARLGCWRRALMRAAQYDEHPWNEGLLIESLAGTGAFAMTPDTSGLNSSAPPQRRMDTLRS